MSSHAGAQPAAAAAAKGRNANFFRAFRYLAPYRGLVAVSVCCALLVGVVFTGGLGAMLPIFKVLLDDQTIGDWASRQVVEKRLGVNFDDDANGLRIARVKPGRPAAAAGLKKEDVIVAVAAATATDGANQRPLRQLSDATGSAALVLADGRRVDVTLPPTPWYLRLFANLAARFPTDPVKAIAAVFGIVFCLALFGSLVRFFQEHLSDRAAFYAINDVRAHLYNHVLHVPMSFFGLRGTSDVTSRLVQDSGQLQEGFKVVLGQSIQEPIKAAMALGLSLYISWQLTLFIVLFAPLMAVLIKKFGKRMRRVSRKAMQESSSMLGQVEGTLAGIRVVKGARAERFERRRYRRIMRELVSHQVRLSRIDAMSSPILETLTLLVVGAVVMYAAYLVKVARTLDTEYFFLVMACLMMIAESLRKVSKVNNHLQKANAAAGRIFEILDVPVEQQTVLSDEQQATGENGQSADSSLIAHRPSLRRKLPPIQRELAFENVTFTYPNSNSPALVNVSLTVPKGRSIAVVGRNGSGKTTLLALLPRFYDPQQGRVTIDGIDIGTVSLGSLRNQITIVTQDPVIFPGTIASNIAYGQPRATREQIVEAAKRAFAHDFILDKPDGYDTVLGELGGQLSGGQKQRLCIARAILRQAPILILDEATSQVDAESEHLIQQAIENLMHERTTFVIAHRFSTITSADEIIVMDRGRIVGRGQHEQLLRTCETYQQLYERQLFTPTAPAAATA